MTTEYRIGDVLTVELSKVLEAVTDLMDTCQRALELDPEKSPESIRYSQGYMQALDDLLNRFEVRRVNPQ